MASIPIEQDDEGPFLVVRSDQVDEVRRALFQAAIPFQELPGRGPEVVFRFEESVPQATLLRALEAVP